MRLLPILAFALCLSLACSGGEEEAPADAEQEEAPVEEAPVEETPIEEAPVDAPAAGEGRGGGESSRRAGDRSGSRGKGRGGSSARSGKSTGGGGAKRAGDRSRGGATSGDSCCCRIATGGYQNGVETIDSIEYDLRARSECPDTDGFVMGKSTECLSSTSHCGS